MMPGRRVVITAMGSVNAAGGLTKAAGPWANLAGVNTQLRVLGSVDATIGAGSSWKLSGGSM